MGAPGAHYKLHYRHRAGRARQAWRNAQAPPADFARAALWRRRPKAARMPALRGGATRPIIRSPNRAREEGASTHPQEKLQIRRMADASLALAERRAGDLKVAVEKLGAEAPSSRALFGLRMMGLVAPPRSAGIVARLRGILVLIVTVIVIVALGAAIVELISLPFGRVSLPAAVLLGVLLDAVALGILAAFGRRRQRAARAKPTGGA